MAERIALGLIVILFHSILRPQRLIASGHVHQRRDFTCHHTSHVWAPSASFVISDARQDRIGTKEVGLVEYRFQPDSFEVRQIRAPGHKNSLDDDFARVRPRCAPGATR
jgi:hypothetical protein